MSRTFRAALGALLALAAIPWLNAEARLRRLETLDPVADAPSGSFVEVDGMVIHYEASGHGDPVVLIHGFAGSIYSWRHNVGALASAARVYAVDLPGFGYSHRTSRPVFTLTAQARIVKRFLDAVERRDAGTAAQRPRRQVVLVGNSMGAGVALRFALDYPELTRGLVLTGPAIVLRLPWQRLLGVFALPVIGRMLARTIYYYALANERATAGMMASAYGSRIDEVTEELRENLLRPIRVRGSADSALGLARSHDDRPFWECLHRVRVPVLIIAGEQDRAAPLESVRRLQSRLPNTHLVILRHAGHLVQEDEPDEFNRLVLAFLSELSTES